ncbi:amino acid ABC transporter substrate-binding protein [Rhodoplanes elegans]|nr:amino acid ABC transporter substrate-binding protein [Rhodoplanes elegans]
MTSFDQVRRRVLVLAAGLAAALAGAAPATAQQNPIVIGGTLGLTGAYAEPSTDYKFVYDRWVEEVNKKGGLLGRPVKMVIYNDESTPTVAQSLYNRLLDQDKVDLVIAPYTTFVGGAVVPIVMSHEKLLFNGGFVGINIFKNNKGSMIGSFTYQEPDYTRGLFEMLGELPPDQKPKRLAVFTSQNPFTVVVRAGLGGTGGVLGYAKAAGIPIVVDEQYPPTTTDFNGLVQKARAANADMVLALGLPNDTLNIARTVHQQGLKPMVFCTCGSQVTTLSAWPKLGEAAENGFGTTIAWPTQGYPGLAELAEVFKTRGYDTLPTYAIVGYAILQVIEQAVAGAKTLDQAKLKEYIYANEFKTAAGTFRYQPDGTPVFSQVLLQFQNGKNQVVWPKQARTAPPVFAKP